MEFIKKIGYDISVSLDEIISPIPVRTTQLPEIEVAPPVVEEENRQEIKPIVIAPRKRENKSIILLIGLIIVAVLGLVVFIVKNKNKISLSNKVTINYWGLWEESNVMDTVISDFEAKNPGIKINYKKNQITDYRTRLKSKLAKTETSTDEDGVDVFRFHASWMPNFKDDLASVPTTTAKNLDLDKDFYEVYKRDLQINGVYKAIPIMYDGLSLFYNKDLLDKAGSALPQTWTDLLAAAEKMQVVDESGNIKVAGAALGLTENVDHWSDIVGLMLQQSGKGEQNAKDVISYYTYFATNKKLWNESLPPSTEFFASGRLGFYFGPSWRIFDIETKNPQLNFGITTVPQLQTSEAGQANNLTNIHWSSYWVEGVNKKSKKQKEIWKFMEFLASKESMQKMFSVASQVRSFGEISPRKSEQTQMMANAKIKPFVMAADNAYSWYLSSNTFDNGINDEMIKYFGDAINGITSGQKSIDDAITTLQSGITQVKQRYNINK